MKQQMRNIAWFALPHAFIMIFCLIMTSFGVVTEYINSFCVDLQGILYVGEGNSVNKYQNGIQIGSIQLKSSSYAFAIDSNDILTVAYPSAVYKMDSSGNIIEYREEHAAQTYSQLSAASRKKTEYNGDQYRKVSELGWSRIIKNGEETVYQISTFSFVVKMLAYLCFASLFINGFWFVRRMRNMKW